MALSWLKGPIQTIKSKSWQEKLGKAMRCTAKIVELTMPPGSGAIVGGALTFGFKVLDALDENEVTADMVELRKELHVGFKEIEQEVGKVESSINELRSFMTKDLEQTMALRFRYPLGKIESSYDRMMKMGKIKMDIATKPLKNKFENLEIKAVRYLKPEAIRKYLEAIPSDEDNEMRGKVMRYCLIVRAKFLMIATLHYIHNEELEAGKEFLAEAFTHFNHEYKAYLEIYKDLTGQNLIVERADGK